MTHSTNPDYFIDQDNTSGVTAHTGVLFNNSDINLNGADFTITEGKLLSVRNGHISGCNIISTHFDFYMENAYCNDITFPDVTLYGEIDCASNVVFNGNVTVEGTLENRSNGYSTVSFYGTVRNNGVVDDNYYTLTVNAFGDIVNNGSWSNVLTYLDGSSTQNITLVNNHSINGEVRLDANFSGTSFAWYNSGASLVSNGSFSGATTPVLIFEAPVSSGLTGEYYCVNEVPVQSRSIFVSTATQGQYALDLKVFLQGPYNGTDMIVNLAADDLLPLSQPYLDFPWNYPGTESVTSLPGLNIVDWVVVELRDATNATSANETTIFERRAAFLLNDGSVVATDGSSNLIFNGPVNNGLFVVIRHRNHLDVISANALVESGGTYSYDFTAGPALAYGTGAQIDVGGGVYAMRSGDSNKDGMVTSLDQNMWPDNVGNTTGYNLADYNFDEQIDNKDKNDAWLPNMGSAVQVPE